MPRLPALLFIMPLALPGAAAAQASPVVLELFTSQGCSSCPPADALLAKLASRDGVIPLALHVDYWDYLGWKDDFGKAQYTQRQRGYAKMAGSRTIFTPQMIVQGSTRLKGHDAVGIDAAIAAAQAETPAAEVTLEREGQALDVEIGPVAGAAPAGAADVYLVRFTPTADVAIGGGENDGLAMTYTNIVTDWETIGRWDGTTPMELRQEAVGEGPLAVIVQENRLGPVLGAAELR